MAAPGNPPGTVWAGMTGLQSARFDLLEVYYPPDNTYANIAFFINDLYDKIDLVVATDDARLEAIEAKLTSLDEQKATKFEAVSPHRAR